MSTRTILEQRLSGRVRCRWPFLLGISIRTSGMFAYIDACLPDDEMIALCRLRYCGSVDRWGFAIYRPDLGEYRDAILPSRQASATPEEAFDCAWGLYFASRPV